MTNSASGSIRWAHPGQGIVHVIGPEQGLTLPGMTIVCGDSHTSTHGAFGALAFGIGTSEVEHVLATQTSAADASRRRWRSRSMANLRTGVTAKDVILAIIGKIGTGGGIGHIIEYRGSAIRVAVDGRPDDRLQHVDRSRRQGGHDRAGRDDVRLHRGPAARAERGAVGAGARRLALAADRRRRRPSTAKSSSTGRRSGLTSPGARTRARSSPIDGAVPRSRMRSSDPGAEKRGRRALRIHGPRAGHADARDRGRYRLHRLVHQQPDRGSCGSRRRSWQGARVRPDVRAMVVPGSMRVRAQAEAEGLDRIFIEAGFEWRAAGCSMCLGMNPDKLTPGRTLRLDSNRNFEGRQGKGGRTHLVSPAVAAATAIAGTFATPAELG